MLDAGSHGGAVCSAALVAVNHGLGHTGVKIRIFAAAFRNATPAGVTGNVKHGGESPSHALGGCLHGRYARAFLY